MSKPKFTTYDNLEVRFDDSSGSNESSNVWALRKLEFKRKEALHLVPTDEEEVKVVLRLLNEPETNEGESHIDRRARLSDLLLENDDYMNTLTTYVRGQATRHGADSEEFSGQEDDEEEFFTPASSELVEARKFLIGYTYDRSKERLMREFKNATIYEASKLINRRRGINKTVQNVELSASQIVSSRPVSQAKLSPTDGYIAYADWMGGIGVLDSVSLDVLCSAENAHTGKVGGVAWSPDGRTIVTGGEDGQVKLFSFENDTIQEIAALYGHERRVAGTAFHPSQKYVASASFDMTWRLWDINSGKEILLQEGHGKEVYCVSFQCDGSLLCSAGLDCSGIIWDIRSGKSPMVLGGHLKPIYSVDWSPNGYQVATGAGDGTIKVWDLRRAVNPYTIPAHNSIVSSVSFSRGSGALLVSSGYDRKVKIFSSDNWSYLASLEGHTDKALCCDISKDTSFIVSSAWDRSIKLWKADI